MEIRSALEGDAEAWWHIRLEALETEPFAFGTAADEHRSLPIESIAKRLRDAPEGNFYLGAFQNGNLIGIATFARDTGVKERHKGRIFGVYVTSSQRRKGVGRALMTALLENAKRDPSLEQILLAVTSGQSAAQRLYRDLGFATYGTEPNALKVGAEYVDEQLMILRVAS